MSTLPVRKTLVGTAIAVALVAGLLFAYAVPAAQAQALTESQIQSILSLLSSFGADQATIDNVDGALRGQATPGSGIASNVCPFTWTRDLSSGSTGADVQKLQQFLNDKGFTVAASGAGSPGQETQFYGALTGGAVQRYQEANAASVLTPLGLTSGTPFFGPSTRAFANSRCTTAADTGAADTGDTGVSVTLEGGAGSLSDVDFVSGLNNEEVGEGEVDEEVAGLDIEADDGSDIMITAVTLDFDKGTAVAAGNDFVDYASEVSVWLDGEEFARVDASEFEDDDNFAKTVSLDRGAVIRANERGDLVVRVSGATNIDSTDTSDTWDVAFVSVRFEDAQGATITDSTTGDIDDTGSDETTAVATDERQLSFETFATAADVDLKALISSDTPDSQVINADDSNDTDGVVLLRFTLEAEGNSDVRVRDIPIEFATSSANSGVLGEIANTVYLTIGGVEYSESVSSTAGPTITFEDVDFTIDAGDTVDVVVAADINNITTTANDFQGGDDLLAQFTASNREVMDAEDETGENLTSSERSGTATGEAIAFYDVGPMVTFVSAATEITAGDSAVDDVGRFTITYRVEAFDGTIYVSDVAEATLAASVPLGAASTTNMQTQGGVIYTIEQSSTPTVNNVTQSVTFTDITGDPTDTNITNGVELNDGEVAEFDLVVQYTNDADGFAGLYRTLLQGVAWETTDADASDTMYVFNLDDYKTGTISLN